MDFMDLIDSMDCVFYLLYHDESGKNVLRPGRLDNSWWWCNINNQNQPGGWSRPEVMPGVPFITPVLNWVAGILNFYLSWINQTPLLFISARYRYCYITQIVMPPQDVGAAPMCLPSFHVSMLSIYSWDSDYTRADTWVCPYGRGDIFKISGETV